jgi:hypothetical protein
LIDVADGTPISKHTDRACVAAPPNMNLSYFHRPLAAVSFKRSMSIASALCLTWLAPTHAAAWCQASAEVSTNGACVKNPTAPLLFWNRSCVAYGFNVDFFDQIEAMNEREVRSAFQAGFDAWAAVDCAGRAGFFVEQRSATTLVADSEYKRLGPNESVVVAIDQERWLTLPDHSARAVAMTLMWHNRTTGEIMDTDIEINLGAGSFADCVAGSCTAGMMDLQNTITHEAGHVLGLGHSTDTSATMTAQTVGTVDIQKRSLAPDDIEGYCALELPEWECSSASCSCMDPLSTPTANVTRSASCQVASPGARGAAWLWLWLLALLSMVRRRARAA